jgi:hypothetical protein
MGKWDGGRECGWSKCRARVLDSPVAINRSSIDPQRFEGDGNQVVVDFHQVVRDLEGRIISDQMVRHSLLFEEELIKVFKIL